MAFLLDEHLRGPLWQAILQHNLRGGAWLDVVRVGDLPDLPLAADDATILAWAERERRILVTEDRHTMAGHLHDHLAAGRHSPGIVIVRPAQSMRTVVECLALIAVAGEPAEFEDAIAYIP
jgi:predicted nuclease of predicted toxin-antitoxin system